MLAIFQGSGEIIIIEMQNGKIPTKIKNQYFKNGGRDISDYDYHMADGSFSARAEIFLARVVEENISFDQFMDDEPEPPSHGGCGTGYTKV